jgi:release factor glutamine methyltransferase
MGVAAERAQGLETIGALVESASARLGAAGIETARLDAEVLLAEAAGVDRTALYAGWRRAVPAGRATRFDALLARRLAREPLQYIVGRQEFWSREFAVSPAVLIPRPETELLVELALRKLACSSGSLPYEGGARGGFDGTADSTSPFPLLGKEGIPSPDRTACQHRSNSEAERRLRLCDLGTGSGCIAVTLAHELPQATVWAIDDAPAALAMAAANAQRHNVAARVRLLHSHIFAAAGDLCFDAIISNPPYIASDALRRLQPELGWEPTHALDGGFSGLDVIEGLLVQSHSRLRQGGWLIMEIGSDQRTAVARLAYAAGFCSVSVEPDYAGHPRALLARRV